MTTLAADSISESMGQTAGPVTRHIRSHAVPMFLQQQGDNET